MQCHVEMTEELVNTWLETGRREIDESRSSPGVQRPEEIRNDLEGRLGRLHDVASTLYDRWTEGLGR